jgi:hypothetical protein
MSTVLRSKSISLIEELKLEKMLSYVKKPERKFALCKAIFVKR